MTGAGPRVREYSRLPGAVTRGAMEVMQDAFAQGSARISGPTASTHGR
jgi:hypothetical protein